MANSQKLDLLMLAAHPDDAELGCAGTLLRYAAAGRKVGVVDLTRGELGSRGSAELRDEEAAEAARILGLHVRENLRMRDGFFRNDEEHQRRIIEVIRRFRPELILTNPNIDRHPDHGRAADLVHDAAFLAGLPKVQTQWEGEPQAPWRPRLLLQAIHNSYVRPDIVVEYFRLLGAEAGGPHGLPQPVLPPGVPVGGNQHLHIHPRLSGRAGRPQPGVGQLHWGAVCGRLHQPAPPGP
ncbi:bacillithiol biosynthesis deacetylase BshB1 [Hymenobacter sp. BT18]|uniref:bacillithiol biosynthesis deacetylase BshB1 n=1 Tax=Hymenobacter sp. BT18 TaxID=2835648 RepID=UPI00293B94FD|nr:bacillithiol biosynthesis deacetylase BshB1 [Hymenobacter sp. BT18]